LIVGIKPKVTTADAIANPKLNGHVVKEDKLNAVDKNATVHKNKNINPENSRDSPDSDRTNSLKKTSGEARQIIAPTNAARNPSIYPQTMALTICHGLSLSRSKLLIKTTHKKSPYPTKSNSPKLHRIYSCS
jgi:hypothetical protein